MTGDYPAPGAYARLPHPHPAGVNIRPTPRALVQEAVDRLTERLHHKAAGTETVAAAREDILALLAEIEDAAARACDMAEATNGR